MKMNKESIKLNNKIKKAIDNYTKHNFITCLNLIVEVAHSVAKLYNEVFLLFDLNSNGQKYAMSLYFNAINQYFVNMVNTKDISVILESLYNLESVTGDLIKVKKIKEVKKVDIDTELLKKSLENAPITLHKKFQEVDFKKFIDFNQEKRVIDNIMDTHSNQVHYHTYKIVNHVGDFFKKKYKYIFIEPEFKEEYVKIFKINEIESDDFFKKINVINVGKKRFYLQGRCQVTDFKDKNNKEIYEKDIVDYMSRRYKVEYKGKWLLCDYYGEIICKPEWNLCQVVGNMLIKKDNKEFLWQMKK